MTDDNKRRFSVYFVFVRLIGVMVPRRLRADWKQEWEGELRYRELLLDDWDKLDWRHKLDLIRRSLGTFWDALSLQTYPLVACYLPARRAMKVDPLVALLHE